MGMLYHLNTTNLDQPNSPHLLKTNASHKSLNIWLQASAIYTF